MADTMADRRKRFMGESPALTEAARILEEEQNKDTGGFLGELTDTGTLIQTGMGLLAGLLTGSGALAGVGVAKGVKQAAKDAEANEDEKQRRIDKATENRLTLLDTEHERNLTFMREQRELYFQDPAGYIIKMQAAGASQADIAAVTGFQEVDPERVVTDFKRRELEAVAKANAVATYEGAKSEEDKRRALLDLAAISGVELSEAFISSADGVVFEDEFLNDTSFTAESRRNARMIKLRGGPNWKAEALAVLEEKKSDSQLAREDEKELIEIGTKMVRLVRDNPGISPQELSNQLTEEEQARFQAHAQALGYANAAQLADVFQNAYHKHTLANEKAKQELLATFNGNWDAVPQDMKDQVSEEMAGRLAAEEAQATGEFISNGNIDASLRRAEESGTMIRSRVSPDMQGKVREAVMDRVKRALAEDGVEQNPVNINTYMYNLVSQDNYLEDLEKDLRAAGRFSMKPSDKE